MEDSPGQDLRTIALSPANVLQNQRSRQDGGTYEIKRKYWLEEVAANILIASL